MGHFSMNCDRRQQHMWERSVLFVFLLPSGGITCIIVSAIVKNENLKKGSINPCKKAFHPYSQ